ncbi:4-hydroxythreonine-4-phosphate dehydrogenase PdxA [Labrys okinawensis]|uniref:4-hydroxythreonine-4-phosphate dehydrogenase n=1 Tax=Labrys okinawensis TaxID=346911 RepID=A0A2S9QG00_9HYPH|nr:4-hydroxythreonine-4-phosphate dehydrogenase PdxA [Labrys okinawensis]PRH88255.1 4-hydroxythreonine-4-phosphate dehydrogenase PdxA [Labrys okinawensis]
MPTEHPSLPIALTMGEPAGIGPELIVMAASARHEAAPFFVYGDAGLLSARARRIGLDLTIVETDEAGTLAAFTRGLPVVPLANAAPDRPGRPDVAGAAAVIESIERAVLSVRRGHARAVVTPPIMKEVLYRAGFRHPGHTEFLGELACRHWQDDAAQGLATGGQDRETPFRPVMMIWSETVAVVPVTIHIPLSRVPAALTEDLIYETGLITARDLKARFNIAAPRLAVAGLNPHAGENGALGSEDSAVVAPAIARLRAQGIDARGPLPADTMFHARARQTYDAALCMYHDQALAPAKALAFDEAVNVTLGLPFVRTSPDHGTAFDLAGTGKANPSSFLASLSLADRMSR